MVISELNKIERSIVIDAPRSRVWRALTNIEEFCQWFSADTARKQGYFIPGMHLRLVCTDETSKDVAVDMEVEEVTPKRVFSWRWHPGSVQPGVDHLEDSMTLVTFLLEDVQGGTRVTVLETGFDKISLARRAVVFRENTAGWEYQMSALEKYLREKA